MIRIELGLWNPTLCDCMSRNPYVIFALVPLTAIYDDSNWSEILFAKIEGDLLTSCQYLLRFRWDLLRFYSGGFRFSSYILVLDIFSCKGAHRRTGDGQVLSVSRVIKHPSFNKRHLRHDVAVLKLARPATLGGKINTICLPSHGSRVSQGTKCYVTGKILITMNFLPPLSPIWKRD